MRVTAVIAAAKGGPDVLVAGAIDLAWPRGPRDVLVRLIAAGVNPADCFFRQSGGYVSGPQPLVLGHDGAGIVEAVGPQVDSLGVGARVAFCNGGIGGEPGTYAAFAVVPVDQLAIMPPSIPFEMAAALPLVVITAWESLKWRAGLKAGEAALIHGGAGGTGHIAIQLARLGGARVATTVSSPEKAAFVGRLGADLAIDYRNEDFAMAALAFTGGRGIDVALDNAGAEVLRKTYRCMAPYGRIVTLMGLAGDDEFVAYNSNLSIICEMMLTPMWRGLRDRLAAQAAIVQECLQLVAAGNLKVEVSAIYPLARAAEAHARLEAGGSIGKIVLSIAG